MNKSPYKGEKGFIRVLNATNYSISGFVSAFKLEAAFRQILLLNIISLIINLLLDLTHIERALLICAGIICIIVELFNSAIEAVVDRISLEHHELSKNAKDMGSAAQFSALFLLAVVWFFVILSKL